MQRTRKILTVMGLVLPVLYFGSVSDAAAFCIHNWTDTVIGAKQVHGGTDFPFKRFNHHIDPGEKSCCNWDTHDCNTQGGRGATVKFDIWFEYPVPGAPGANKNFVVICDNFTIKANGKVVVHGHGGEPLPGTYEPTNNYACKKE